MSANLKSKTLNALFWSFLERFSQHGIQFVISIILARLLLPEEFGLIAMLMIFMAIAQAFIDSGFGQAYSALTLVHYDLNRAMIQL